MASWMEQVFRSGDPQRDAFLSRLFGIFAEDLVRDWCACPQARYEDLGRPTIHVPGEIAGCTLDFTLRDRRTGQVYVTEMKCELQYENHRYLRLVHRHQLLHHRSRAFVRFRALAGGAPEYQVKVGGEPIPVDGTVLIWGATSPAGRQDVMEAYGFTDVLSVEDIVGDLRRWRPDRWVQRSEKLRDWSAGLFTRLTEP